MGFNWLHQAKPQNYCEKTKKKITALDKQFHGPINANDVFPSQVGVDLINYKQGLDFIRKNFRYNTMPCLQIQPNFWFLKESRTIFSTEAPI